MSTLTRSAALLACAGLTACGDSGVASSPPKNVSGNWYFTDGTNTPIAAQPSEIGAALRSVNGQITGNVNVSIVGNNGLCASYGLDLPASGTVDGNGHLVLMATDTVDTMSLNANLATSGSSFVNGTFRADGEEAYPQQLTPQSVCTTVTGDMDGLLMPPVNATYAGTLSDGNTTVQVQLTTHQDTIPVEGGWSNPHATPDIITRGHLNFLVGGFFVTGTMQLASPVCGVTTATIQPKTGYVWGTVLQMEFDTDTTYQRGATFATLIQPDNGSLVVYGANIYNETQSPICLVSGFGGVLTRQ